MAGWCIPLIEQILAVKDRLNSGGHFGARVDQPHGLAHRPGNHRDEQWIMGTAQDQGIDPSLFQRLEVFICNCLADRMVPPAFFCESDKQGARLLDDLRVSVEAARTAST